MVRDAIAKPPLHPHPVPLLGEWNKAGEPSGLVHVGGLAYSTNGIESGWIPTPTVGIFTAPELEEYRRSISLFSYEGQKPLHGSFFSENIEDYYTSPFELGYGKSIAFNHDFIGRKALEAAQDRVRRTKVTLVVDPEDARKVFGANPDFFLTYGRYRVEAGSALVGRSPSALALASSFSTSSAESAALPLTLTITSPSCPLLGSTPRRPARSADEPATVRTIATPSTPACVAAASLAATMPIPGVGT